MLLEDHSTFETVRPLAGVGVAVRIILLPGTKEADVLSREIVPDTGLTVTLKLAEALVPVTLAVIVTSCAVETAEAVAGVRVIVLPLVDAVRAVLVTEPQVTVEPDIVLPF
ncbi:MAG: hypothetical protein K2P37_04925 [Oscillospiraceae bacterium]|nr:hypothetical protein [Oscillospiraceae bacterium]